jgi:hypothetical protein
MKTTKKQKIEYLRQIEECLYIYYRLSGSKKNQWRYNAAIEVAKKRIENNEEVIIKGAQWGGKWGNYYRMIALNSKNEYQYVEGFNPKKYLV